MVFLRVPFRWLASRSGIIAVIIVASLITAWRPVSLAWQCRSARNLMCMGSIRQSETARITLESLHRLDPLHPEVTFLLARACRRTGAVDESLRLLEEAESAGWDPQLIQQQRQLVLFQRGHIENSEALNQLLRQNAADELAYEVYEALTMGYMFSYRYADALQCIDFWTNWCHDSTDPRMWRASIWEQTEQWDKAAAEYRGVIQLEAAHLEARRSLGRILLIERNDPENAAREFRMCLRHQPDDFPSLLGLASCERRLARPDVAEQRLRGLLSRDLTQSQLAAVKLELGQILLERRANAEAITMLSDVVQADPLNSAAHYALGTAYAAGGDQDQAGKCFHRSGELGEEFDRLTTITSELVAHPEKADLRWEAGQILFDQGMTTEGAAWMATALIYDPDHKPTHRSLAEYYEKIKPNERLAAHHREKAAPAE